MPHNVSRRDAKNQGLTHYSTGKPCKHGHIAPRFTEKGTCTQCMRIIASSPAKKAYDAAYNRANAEWVSQRGRRWIQKNKERVLQNVRTWVSKNPEKRRAILKAYKSRRRSKELAGSSTAELMAWEKSARKDCHWCGVKCDDKFEVDHYVPLAKGGRHEIANLVIACPPCNRRKSAKDPYQFAAEVGRLF